MKPLKPTEESDGFSGPPGREAFQDPAETGREAWTFDALLDQTFERLEGTRNQGALKRIGRMEDVLKELEDELTRIIECTSCGAGS